MRRVIQEFDWQNHDNVLMGAFSYHHYQTRTTYVCPEYAVEWRGEIDSPSWHVRNFLNEYRPSRSGEETKMRQPIYAQPCRLHDGIYFDVAQAYRQIISVWGLETVWKDLKPVGYGMTVLNDPLFENKLCRALVVSMCERTMTRRLWINKQVLVNTQPNYLYSPSLLTAVYATLHWMANVFWPYRYWHTDGFIVPAYAESRVIAAAEKYGIQIKAKARGETVVYGAGSYRVGDKKTLRQSAGAYNNVAFGLDLSLPWLRALRRRQA